MKNDKLNFDADKEHLKSLDCKAVSLQEKFCRLADEFNKKYKGCIFKDEDKKEEWVFYHCDPWNHNFYFELTRISKKNPNLTTKENKYISLNEFSLLKYTGRKIKEGEK